MPTKETLRRNATHVLFAKPGVMGARGSSIGTAHTGTEPVIALQGPFIHRKRDSEGKAIESDIAGTGTFTGHPAWKVIGYRTIWFDLGGGQQFEIEFEKPEHFERAVADLKAIG